MSSLFSKKKTTPEVNKQIPTLTSGQLSTLNSLNGYVQGQIGQGAEAYPGTIMPGASALQAKAFGLAQDYGTDAAGQARQSAIADILSGKPAWSQISADPYYQAYNTAVEAPSMLNFKTGIIPQILQAYGAGGPTGAVVSGLGDAGASLAAQLGAGRASFVDQNLARAAQDRIAGVGMSADESQRRIALMGAAGDTQRGITGDQLAESYGKWQSSQSYNNPALGFIPQILGTQAFQTYYQPSQQYSQPTFLGSMMSRLSPQNLLRG